MESNGQLGKVVLTVRHWLRLVLCGRLGHIFENADDSVVRDHLAAAGRVRPVP